MLDLEAVLALRAVATGGSVAVAAETLGYTPSAVSQQIKRLERATGVTLLERAGRGVVLTDAGRQLVTTSAPVLADLERIEADLQLARSVAAEQVTGEVRVAAFSTAVRGLLVEVLAGLRREHPALRVPLRESEPWETVALVASGQRDLGIEYAANLARAVADGGAPGIHLYAFNNHDTVLAVLREAGILIQKENVR